jgi:hypothetical protein
MKQLLLVGIGGGIGAISRYKLGGWVLHHSVDWRFPLGTFVVNVLGCLVTRTVLPGCVPCLSTHSRAIYKMYTCLMRVSFNMQGVERKFPSNNTFGTVTAAISNYRRKTHAAVQFQDRGDDLELMRLRVRTLPGTR